MLNLRKWISAPKRKPEMCCVEILKVLNTTKSAALIQLQNIKVWIPKSIIKGKIGKGNKIKVPKWFYNREIKNFT